MRCDVFLCAFEHVTLLLTIACHEHLDREIYIYIFMHTLYICRERENPRTVLTNKMQGVEPQNEYHFIWLFFFIFTLRLLETWKPTSMMGYTLEAITIQVFHMHSFLPFDSAKVMNMIVAVLVHVVSSVATLQQISQQNGGLNAGNSAKKVAQWKQETRSNCMA